MYYILYILYCGQYGRQGNILAKAGGIYILARGEHSAQLKA